MSNPQSRWRVLSYRALIVLFVLGVVASTTVIWANVRIQDSDSWAATVGPLADDPAVQAFVVDQAALVIDRKIAADEDAGRLQNYSRTQLSGLARMALSDFVSSPTFATWWTEANRSAHGLILRTLDDEQGVLLQSQAGDLVLDLQPAVDWVNGHLQMLFPNSNYVIKLGPEQSVIVLYSSDALVTASRMLDLVDTLAVVFPIVTLLILAGAVVLKQSFTAAITQIALSLAAGMVLVLVLINIGLSVFISQQPESHQDVLDAVIRISLVDLVVAFRAIAVVALIRAGIVILLKSKYVNNPRVKAFFRNNREAIVTVAMGSATLWLVFASYPPMWLTILVTIAIVSCGVLLYRWTSHEITPERSQ